MKITSAGEMRVIDRATGMAGVPSLTLMENAGTAVARFAMELYPAGRRFVSICGKGNNGGDGLVAARKLHEAGRQAEVLLLAAPGEFRGDAAEMLARLGLPAIEATSMAELGRVSDALARADVVLDAILGTGFVPPVRGLYAETIRLINAAQKPVIAVDIPSGAAADATAPDPAALVCRADAIVTFTAARPAHVLAGLTRGPVRVVPIGSPDDLVVSELGMELIAPRDFAGFLGPRDPDGHKGRYGHVLVVGGSVGKAGAAAMAGMAAARMGAGLTTVGTARSALPIVAGFAPELMTEPLAEEEGSISLAAAGDSGLGRMVEGKTVLAIGPGISRHPETVLFVHRAVAASRLPAVIDADGLNAFAGQAELLDGRERSLVLTPHPGEMSRLTGLSIQAVQADRVGVARPFARDHHCVLVLKGHRTLVAFPDGMVWINVTGNPGMATGGTGDILTGMVAGAIAQMPGDVPQAVLAAVCLHGLAGDVAAERMGEHSMLATDLLAALPEAFRRARNAAAKEYVEFR